MKIITPSFSIPDIGHMAMMQHATSVTMEVHEHYQKRSCRNRFTIVDHQGLKTLSIPLKKGKNAQLPIREAEIAYSTDWQYHMLKTIKSAYGKSAFFEHYMDSLENIFHQKDIFLFDFNQRLRDWIIQKLKLSLHIELSTNYLDLVPTDIIDYRKGIHPIDNEYYPQVFEDRLGFVPNASCLDLLFCLGPEAKQYLMRNPPLMTMD